MEKKSLGGNKEVVIIPPVKPEKQLNNWVEAQLEAKLEKQLAAWVEAQLEAARLFYKNSEKREK